jgi:hypothetical protein
MAVCHTKPLCKHLKIMYLIPRKKWIALNLQFPSQQVRSCQNFTPPTFYRWTNFIAWKPSAMSNPQVQNFLIQCSTFIQQFRICQPFAHHYFFPKYMLSRIYPHCFIWKIVSTLNKRDIVIKKINMSSSLLSYIFYF